MRLTRLLPIAVASFIAGTGASSADMPNTHTWKGIPLAEPRLFEVQGRYFRVPQGYLTTWGHPESLEEIIKRDTLSFSFWMPSLRFPEVEKVGTPSFRPVEPGRKPPEPREFIVSIKLVNFDVSRKSGIITPSEMFLNFTLIDGMSAFAFRETRGLMEFWNTKKPNAFSFYREIDGTHPKVFLRCSLPSSNLPNPLCSGFVHLENDDLQFWINFSVRDLEHWRQSALAARSLIFRWQIQK